MIPSILSQQLRQGVEDFLRTTFPVSTPFFHGIIDRLLADSESEVHERALLYVSATRAKKRGCCNQLRKNEQVFKSMKLPT